MLSDVEGDQEGGEAGQGPSGGQAGGEVGLRLGHVVVIAEVPAAQTLHLLSPSALLAGLVRVPLHLLKVSRNVCCV